MLVFRFGKIAKHVRGRAEKDEPSAFIEQDRFVKHLEEFGARLVNGDNDDLVVRHSADDLHDVLGVLRGEAGSRFIEKINVRHADHIEPDVEAFALAAAQRFLLGLPTTASRRSPRPSSISFASRRRMRSRRERCGERIAAANCRFSPMVRCSSNASCCGM